MGLVIFIIVFGLIIWLVSINNRSKANLAAHARERMQMEAKKRENDAEIMRQRRREIEIKRNEASKAWHEEFRQTLEEVELRQAAEVRKKSELLKIASYLSEIDPIELENLCLIVFAKLGYEAKSTSRTNDNGADGFLKKDGKLTILQCKRYQGVVGEPALRDLLGTMHHFRASSAIIVTTGRLTQSASKWIAGKPIRVICRAELSEMIKNNISESDLISRNGSLPKIPEPKSCPECGAPLEKKFWPSSAREQLPPIYLVCAKGKACGYRKRLN